MVGPQQCPQTVYPPWVWLAVLAASSTLGTLPSLAAVTSDQCEGLIISSFSPQWQLPDLCFLSPSLSTILTFSIN